MSCKFPDSNYQNNVKKADIKNTCSVSYPEAQTQRFRETFQDL